MRAPNKETSNIPFEGENTHDSRFIGDRILKRIALVAGLLLFAFLLGYMPAWLSARGYEYERNNLQREIRLDSMRQTLASAVINVNLNRFEEARVLSSQFFTNLREELDRADSAIKEQDRRKIEDMLVRRDEVITGLAKGNPEVGRTLSDWYFDLEKIHDFE